MNELPSDPPIGVLDEATIIMHEIFESYKRAGFDYVTALELVKVHLFQYLGDTDQ